MKLFVHIGIEKTGTTLLQRWLYSNKTQLSGQGYFLSDMLGKFNNRKLVAYFCSKDPGYWQQNGIASREDKDRHFSGFIQSFEEELRRASSTHHTCIVSSEHFHSRLVEQDDLENFAEFCKQNFSEVRVLAYLRSQYEVRKSLYSTYLKGTGTERLSAFQVNTGADNYYYNYHLLAQRWANVFGKKSINLRLFDRDQFVDGDLRKDFLDVLGWPCSRDHLNYKMATANESLALLMSAAFIGVNRAVSHMPKNARRRIGTIFKNRLLFVDKLRSGIIFDDCATTVHGRFDRSNQSLSDEFFDGRELFSAPKKVDRQPLTYSEEEVFGLISDIVETMVSVVGGKEDMDADAAALIIAGLKIESGEKLSLEDIDRLMESADRVVNEHAVNSLPN